MRAKTGGLAALVVGITALAAGPGATGQTPAGGLPKPIRMHAHDVRVRKGGEQDWKTAARIGVEFFKDSATEALMVVTQVGSLAVAHGGPAGGDKTAQWLFAHDLRARKADEDKFTPATTKYGVEAFKDTASGKLLYVTEKAAVALADTPPSVAADREPAWHHALVLKVRGAAEKDFTATTKRYGVEAFKDGHTGGLIYVTDAGSIATAPAPAQPPAPDQVKRPAHLYGLVLHVRTAEEADFTKDTRRVGVEVFRDDNAGVLVYISETGAVATAPVPADVKTGQGVLWKHAFMLAARPGGVTEFAKANKFGVEVFQDNNTGHLVYVTDTASIAVLAKK